MKQAESDEAAGEGGSNGRSQEEMDQAEPVNTVGEDGVGQGNSFSKYASLDEAHDDASAFKWNFVTSKLAELKNKTTTKSN